MERERKRERISDLINYGIKGSYRFIIKGIWVEKEVS